MLLIGVTGSIGAGKSKVTALLAGMGCRVSDADQLARALTAPGGAAMDAIRGAFGAGVIAADGALDRAAMRELAFKDPSARARLEAILHPMIIAARAELIAELAGEERRSGREVLFVSEAALSIEAGLAGEFDAMIVVTAPDEVRRARVAARDPHGADHFAKADGAQMGQPEKLRRADLVIDNGGGLDALSRLTEEALAEARRRGTALRQAEALRALGALPAPAPGSAHEIRWRKKLGARPEVEVEIAPAGGRAARRAGPPELADSLLAQALREAGGGTLDLDGPTPPCEFLPHDPPPARAGSLFVEARLVAAEGGPRGEYRRVAMA